MLGGDERRARPANMARRGRPPAPHPTKFAKDSARQAAPPRDRLPRAAVAVVQVCAGAGGRRAQGGARPGCPQASRTHVVAALLVRPGAGNMPPVCGNTPIRPRNTTKHPIPEPSITLKIVLQRLSNTFAALFVPPSLHPLSSLPPSPPLPPPSLSPSIGAGRWSCGGTWRRAP